MKIWLILLVTIPLLSSCSTTKEQVKRIFVKPEISIADTPRPLNLHKDIKWDVVNYKNIQEYLNEIQRGNLYVFYAISVRDYEKLALNIDELKRYIKQQKEIIAYYENAVREK